MGKKLGRLLTMVVFSLCLAGMGVGQAKENNKFKHFQVKPGADYLYLNGTILTMDDEDRIANAMAVTGDKIVGVGKLRHVAREFLGYNTKLVNLKRKTLLPGFYDAHGHMAYAGMQMDMVVLNSPPIGTMNTMADVIAALKLKAAETPAGGWVQGMGYDDTLLAEMRHPTRYDLDQVSTEHPVYIHHTSGHLAVANSKALELAGITRDSVSPEGGVIVKDANGEPTGVLEEAPAMDLVSHVMPPLDGQKMMAGLAWVSDQYASKGVTTGNDGLAGTGLVKLFIGAAQYGMLSIRVNLWPDLESVREGVYHYPLGSDLLSFGGIKDVADGSIQGYTGYLKEPYHVQPEGKVDYRGYPRHSLEVLKARTKEAHDGGYQSIIHGNGDAAIEDILAAWEEAQEANPREDVRNVVIHAQMMTEDQMDRMEELGAIPSFFNLHTYYWGERHWNIFMGPDRAARMSPAKSAVDRGMPFTLHTDTPIVPMDPLLMVWSAVNRLSYEGNLIGYKGDLDQRIEPLDALKAVTIYPAFQNFEEDIKGSIEPGKLADFVILSKNPLAINPKKIKDIQVLETIVGGKTVYKAVK